MWSVNPYPPFFFAYLDGIILVSRRLENISEKRSELVFPEVVNLRQVAFFYDLSGYYVAIFENEQIL